MKILTTSLIMISSLFFTSSSHLLTTELFIARFPQKPVYKSQNVNLGISKSLLHLYILELDQTTFVISYNYYPLSIDLSNSENFLNGVIKSSINSYKGQLINQEDLEKKTRSRVKKF